MSSYGYSKVNHWEDVPDVGYTIDLVTRKIRFKYQLSCDIGFEFSLLSECRDDVQEILKEMMEEDGIVLGISDTVSDYCNVVMFGNLPWEESEE